MSTIECVNSYLHAFCVHESSHIAIYLATECVLGRIDAFCGQPIALRSNYCHARLRPGISSAFIGRFAALWVFVPGAEKCAWPKNPPAPLRVWQSGDVNRKDSRCDFRRDRILGCRLVLSRQIIAAQQALPTAAYLTRSLRPTRRMVVVVMPLSWQSLLMVVWCCLAILERVSPFLMV